MFFAHFMGSGSESDYQGQQPAALATSAVPRVFLILASRAN